MRLRDQLELAVLAQQPADDLAARADARVVLADEPAVSADEQTVPASGEPSVGPVAERGPVAV